MCSSKPATVLRDHAVKHYTAGEQIQVLAAFNQSTNLSVNALNEAIAPLVNPPEEDKLHLSFLKLPTFWDGDRVIITKNSRQRNCSNGDVGTLRILKAKKGDVKYQVVLDDGRSPSWDTMWGLLSLMPAYGLTVHKSQGSEYDTILLPVSKQMSTMLTQNLLYTAIFRGKKQVILIGNREVLNTAMQKRPKPRRSMLVVKTRQRMAEIAS